MNIEVSRDSSLIPLEIRRLSTTAAEFLPQTVQPFSRHDHIYRERRKPGKEIQPTCGYCDLEREAGVNFTTAHPVVGVWLQVIHVIEGRATRQSVMNHL